MKKYIIELLIAGILVSSTGCGGISTEKSEPMSVDRFMEVPQLHNGDSKFYDGEIYTSVGCLRRYDMHGNQLDEYENIISNWIDIDHDVLIYGNFDHEINIAQMNESKEILWTETIFKGEDLMIDPSILKVGDQWYITFTTIEGNVNNADPESSNGKYEVWLYRSQDLHTWEKQSRIVSAENNIEDPDLMYENGSFIFSYEKEIYDKGKSSICITESEDGIKWKNRKEILQPVADQEPGAFEKNKNGYIMYYSSDKDQPGESYMGAKLYYAILDNEFNVIKKDIEIKADDVNGILLYDVCTIDNKQYFLISEDYMTESNMVVMRRI